MAPKRDQAAGPSAEELRFYEDYMRLCVCGEAQQVLQLLDAVREADVGAELDGDGSTGLHLAARGGHLHLAQVLLQRGLDVNLLDQKQRTALHVAGEEAHPECALELVAAGVDVNRVDYLQQTALHKACSIDAVAVVEVLLDSKAEIACVDHSRATPLLVAARQGSIESLKVLLSRFPEQVNATNESGWTSLHLAAHGKEMRRTTYKRGDPKFASAVRSIVEAKAEVNATDEDKKTPLHRTCSTGNAESAAILIPAGADIEAEDNCRWRPIHYACEDGHFDVVKVLLEGKASVQLANPQCLTPLAVATTENEVKIAELLMKHGADPNHKGKGMASAIMIARQDKAKYADLLSLFELGTDVFKHHG